MKLSSCLFLSRFLLFTWFIPARLFFLSLSLHFVFSHLSSQKLKWTGGESFKNYYHWQLTDVVGFTGDEASCQPNVFGDLKNESSLISSCFLFSTEATYSWLSSRCLVGRTLSRVSPPTDPHPLSHFIFSNVLLHWPQKFLPPVCAGFQNET